MLDKKQRPLLHKKKEGLVPGALVYVGDTVEEQTSIRTHRYSSGYYDQGEGFEKSEEGIDCQFDNPRRQPQVKRLEHLLIEPFILFGD